MSKPLEFPKGIYIPGLRVPGKAVERVGPEVELELPELNLRELSILARKRRGGK